jgi:hypothetical protein
LSHLVRGEFEECSLHEKVRRVRGFAIAVDHL